jgi:hypothetical protein
VEALNLKATQAALDALQVTVSAINGFDQAAFDDALAFKADKLALDIHWTSLTSMQDRTDWLTSPEYDLSTHPNSNLALRWEHGQSEPMAVQMFVRVLGAGLDAFADSSVYPYTNPRARVQPRVSRRLQSFGQAVRYVRFQSQILVGGGQDLDDGFSFSVHRIQVYNNAGMIPATFSASNKVLGGENVVSETYSAISDLSMEGAPGLRYVEVDLGADVSVARIVVDAKVLKTTGAPRVILQ